MDAALFTKMLSDKNVLDLRKLGYKFPQADIKEFTELLKNGFYYSLPLKDFSGQNIVYLSSIAQVRLSAAKVLLTPQNSTQLYGVKAMEEEIVSTFTIEQVDFTRDSVRKILSGLAPADESESRIFGMKKGLEFISDPTNQISEETIYQLYEMAIGAYLSVEDRLLPGHFYRHDSVYVVGAKVEHTGLPWQALPERMGELVAFIREDSEINDLLKAALIHFYIAYLHPYFDGNGRMARLMHLWYLVQQGYSSALFVPSPPLSHLPGSNDPTVPKSSGHIQCSYTNSPSHRYHRPLKRFRTAFSAYSSPSLSARHIHRWPTKHLHSSLARKYIARCLSKR